MKKIVLILMINLLLLVSCGTPISWLANGKFTNLYDDKYTGLDSIVTIEGYYQNTNLTEKGNGSSENNIIFYNDGTILKFNNGALIINKNNEKDSIKGISNWGHYNLFGDTIKAQVINNFGRIYYNSFTYDPIKIYDNWFIIKDKNTIKEIYYNVINHDSSYNRVKLNTYKFKPLNQKPDSNCWLKTHEWAWKDGKIIK